MDNLKITLSNPVDPAVISSQVSIKCNGEAVSADAYKLVADGENLIVKFTEPKKFESVYTVTVENFLRDIYGNLLGEDYTFSFTTMKDQIVSTTPEIADKVTGTVYNPSEEPMEAVLVVTIVNPDGSSKVLTQEVSLGVGEAADLAVDFDISTLEEGQKVYSYISNDPETLKPMKNELATEGDSMISEGTTAVTAKVEKANILGNTVKVEGKISEARKELILVTVSKVNEAPALFTLRAAPAPANEIVGVFPVETEEDGSFAHSFIVDGMAEGRYTVAVTGYNVTASTEQSYVNLTPETKAEILGVVNGADTVAKVEAAFELYASEMYLDEELLNDNTYTVIMQQAPYAEYDDIIAMVYDVDSALTLINDYDWSRYDLIFEDYYDVILHEAKDKNKNAYEDYSSNAKNKINKEIVKSKPFASFSAFAKAFDKAVESYKESSSAGGSGGGGGGGSYDKGAANFSISGVNTPASVSPVLFADMADVAWASAHVQQLYSRGIVSAASNYRPHDSVTREEFVKMLVVLSGVALEGEADFADVTGSEWFAPYLAAAKKAGIVKGNSDGTFGVGKNITRQEMVTMASRAVDAMGKTLNFTKEAQAFADASSISDYATDAVDKMQRAGVISGVGDGTFAPAGLASRAQAAVVVANLINAIQ